MSPDTPALRGLLSAITAALDVPAGPDAARLLAARAQAVRVITGQLATGVLDHTAIQSAAHTLTAVTGDLAGDGTCQRDHRHVGWEEQCEEGGYGADGEILICSLPEGHDGDHWDHVDRLHWQVRQELCPDSPGHAWQPCKHGWPGGTCGQAHPYMVNPGVVGGGEPS